MACQMSSPSEIEIDNKDDSRGFLQGGTHNGHSSDIEIHTQVNHSRSFKKSRSKSSSASSLDSSSVSSQLSGYKLPSLEIHPRELELEDSRSREQDLEDTLVADKQTATVITESQSAFSLREMAQAKKRSLTSTSRGSRGSFIDKFMRRSTTVSQEMSLVESRRTTSFKAFRRHIQDGGRDADTDSWIHTVLRQPFKSESKRRKRLLTLLTYSRVNVDTPDTDGMTALHTAADVCDLECARILVAFGANVNSIDSRGRTPLDLLGADSSEMESAICMSDASNSVKSKLKPRYARGSITDLKKFLSTVGGLRGEFFLTLTKPPSVNPFPCMCITTSYGRAHEKDFAEVSDWAFQLTSRYSELERSIQHRASRNEEFSPDEALSLSAQLHEMTLFQKAGSRMLFLDGGGIRGLVQLEILSQIEEKTGRKIIELFDWIVGTSTGGIIALGLVYAKKSVSELRQLYFKMKDEIFGKVKGMSFNTAGLEVLLKEEFSEHVCMDDITYPRVLISAVQKKHINLKLHFFNNCFHDDYCKHCPVWKVARYTSAAPVLFGESDEYVDGGILANNPSESGLSRIQDYYRKRGEKLPISLVVSIGCGKYPIKKLGCVDFLFAGSGGLHLAGLKDGTSNFLSLLQYALVETSVTDENCRSRCEEQNIRYFRLNPRLKEIIDSGETDAGSLISMILQTREEMNKLTDFSNLVLCFHELSQICKKMHARINGPGDNDLV